MKALMQSALEAITTDTGVGRGLAGAKTWHKEERGWRAADGESENQMNVAVNLSFSPRSSSASLKMEQTTTR